MQQIVLLHAIKKELGLKGNSRNLAHQQGSTQTIIDVRNDLGIKKSLKRKKRKYLIINPLLCVLFRELIAKVEHRVTNSFKNLVSTIEIAVAENVRKGLRLGVPGVTIQDVCNLKHVNSSIAKFNLDRRAAPLWST